jgi:hypothetical protein
LLGATEAISEIIISSLSQNRLPKLQDKKKTNFYEGILYIQKMFGCKFFEQMCARRILSMASASLQESNRLTVNESADATATNLGRSNCDDSFIECVDPNKNNLQD